MSRMRVVLVYPRFKYPAGDIPHGPLFLASYLRENLGADVSILDTTFNPSLEYVESFLKKKKPDVVGIYVSTIAFDDALKVASIAKRLCPFVIAGGPHATIMPESLIEKDDIDVVVIAEGELTFTEIIKSLDANKGLDKIKGICFKKNGKLIKTKPREPIEDLDSIPFPAWDLLDMEKYINSWFQLDPIPNLRGTCIIASRGCPFNCKFCQPTLRMIFGNKLRIRSPENVIGEIKRLKKEYKINALWFSDDTLGMFDKG